MTHFAFTRALPILGLALSSISLVPVAYSQNTPFGTMVRATDPEDLARTREVNGVQRLRYTDEEQTNEQSAVAFSGGVGVVIGMRAGRLASGEAPTDRVQCACTPVTLAQDTAGAVSVQALRAGERFITNNDGNEYRNCNNPRVISIGTTEAGVPLFAAQYNYQADGTGDTKRYMKIVDANCNLQTIENRNGEVRDQVLVMAKTNDDCSSSQSGVGPDSAVTQPLGPTNATFGIVTMDGCNGDGDDDGWLRVTAILRQANGNLRIQKRLDAVLAEREERTRGGCVAQGEPPASRAICAWTEGNNQPQRDGVWVASVTIPSDLAAATETSAQQYVVEKLLVERTTEIDGRRHYARRASIVPAVMAGASGALTANGALLTFNRHRGNNNNGEKGGYNRAILAQGFRLSAEGRILPMTELQDITTELLKGGGVDVTHASTAPMIDRQGNPGIVFTTGSMNGGGAQPPSALMIKLDIGGGGLFKMNGALELPGSFDLHLYSNYLGNNPGNQGRNFAGSTLIRSPFDVTKYLLMHAMEGKSPANVANAALKPDTFLVGLPTNLAIATTRQGLAASEATTSGCTTLKGAEGDSTLLLFGCLAFIHIIRRRRA